MTFPRMRLGARSGSARAVVCLAVCLLVATTAGAADRPPVVASRAHILILKAR